MMAASEYIAWEFPIAILTCAFLLSTLDLDEAAPLRFEQLAPFGAFCGFSAGVKLTLLIFPLSVCCVYAAIYRRHPRVLVSAALQVGSIFLLTWFVILLLSAGGSFEQLIHSINGFLLFVGSQSQTLNFIARDNYWLFDFSPHYRFDIGPLAILAPPALLIFGIVFSHLRVLLALVPTSLLSIALYGARPYWITMSETVAFAVICWIVLIATIAKAVRRSHPKTLTWIAIPAGVTIAVAAYTYGAMAITGLTSLSSVSQIFAEDYSKVAMALATHPGRTALIATDNRFSIPSIEGGLCKGAADILDMRWHSESLRSPPISSATLLLLREATDRFKNRGQHSVRQHIAKRNHPRVDPSHRIILLD